MKISMRTIKEIDEEKSEIKSRIHKRKSSNLSNIIKNTDKFKMKTKN